MNCKFVNLTPHMVRVSVNRVLGEQYEDLEFESKGVARVSSTYDYVGGAAGIPFFQVVYGEVTGLPEPQEGVFYIVSLLVLQACPHRKDLVAPASGHPNVIRVDGQIWSVPGFIYNGE